MQLLKKAQISSDLFLLKIIQFQFNMIQSEQAYFHHQTLIAEQI